MFIVNLLTGTWDLDSERVKQFHCSLKYLSDVFPQNVLSAREEKALGIMRSTLVEEACEAIWEVVATVGRGTSEEPQGYNNRARAAGLKAASPLFVTPGLRSKSCGGYRSSATDLHSQPPATVLFGIKGTCCLSSQENTNFRVPVLPGANG